MKMKPFFTVHIVRSNAASGQGETFANEEDALRDAKRRQAADKDNRYAVMRSTAITVLPVPPVEIEAIE